MRNWRPEPGRHEYGSRHKHGLEPLNELWTTSTSLDKDRIGKSIAEDLPDDRLRRSQSMVRDSKEMIDAAIQMAMQNYPRWARGETEMQ